MPTLYLVRHARPSAAWDEDPDPGLDPLGQEQALETARQLTARGKTALLTSPLRRCIETAAPLASLWQQQAVISDAISEIPSPPTDAHSRSDWLATALKGTWSEMQATAPLGSPDFLSWRMQLLRFLLAQRQDAVIFTHYVAINAVVGAARGSDHVVCFHPDYGSITRIDVSNERFHVLELGREAETLVIGFPLLSPRSYGRSPLKR